MIFFDFFHIDGTNHKKIMFLSEKATSFNNLEFIKKKMNFGKGRIRTYVENNSTDLQSVAFNHSATFPQVLFFLCFLNLVKKEPKKKKKFITKIASFFLF